MTTSINLFMNKDLICSVCWLHTRLKGGGTCFFLFSGTIDRVSNFPDTITDKKKIRLSMNRAFKNDISKLTKHGLLSSFETKKKDKRKDNCKEQS